MSTRTTMATTARTILGVGTMVLAVAASSGAQEMVEGGADARWLPFTGCWEATTGGGEVEGRETGDEMLCIRPAAGEEGVEFLTVIDGSVAEREVRRAGARSPVSREGCEGWERTSFSDDGRRVYLRTEHTCRGGVERTTTGIMAMVSPYEWIDVRAVSVQGRAQAWVRRYSEAPDGRVADAGLGDIAAGLGMAVESARMAAASAPEIEAVIDASDAVDAAAVEAWIAELADPFHVDADALVRMADAGVAERVIDVVVAVSYPDRFALDRGGAVTARGPERDRGRYGPRDRYGGGYYPGYRPFYGYHPYSYGLFYSSWYGYGGYGGFGFYRGYRPSVVVVQPRDAGPRGRVVNGRGYTRSRSGSDGPSRSVVPGRAPSGGASISPAGATRGSGASSTGRKAKKRGGSGGDGGDGGGEGGRL